MMIKNLVLLVLVTLAVYGFADRKESALQPTLADYKVGEKWVWKFKGVTNAGVIRAEGIDIKEVVEENNELKMVIGTKSVPLTDVVVKEESNTPRYSWPLQVGKQWKFEQSWTSQDGTQGKTSQSAEVLSYKEITVEAGSFMAYEIKYTGKITNSTGFSAETVDIHWYAPKVKSFIKLMQIQGDYTYIEELTEYSTP